jgi:mannosyltransferase
VAGAEIVLTSRTINRQSSVLLFGVLLLATCLRLNQAGIIPLRADEAANFYLAAKPVSEIITPLVTSDPHLPLFFILLHYWMIPAGHSELSLRYLTIFSAVLMVPLVYVLGRRLFPNSNMALIAAFFAAINPYSIWDSQDAYMYTMLTAAGLTSFITFLGLMRPKASRLAWAAYVLVSAVTIYIHYLGGLILIAEGGIWLWWTVTRTIGLQAGLKWLTAQLAIVALFAPWMILVLPLLAGLGSSMWRPVGLVELLARSFATFSLGRIEGLGMPAMVDRLTAILGSFPFLILMFLGIFLGRRSTANDPKARLVLAFYLFAPLLAFYLFTLVRFPIFDERYVLFLIPPFVLLLARGVTVLRQLTSRVSIAAIAMLIVALLSARSLFNYWYVPAYAKSPDWPDFVRELTADYRPGDVLIQNYPDEALPYYLNGRVPSVLVPGRSSAPMSSVAPRMQQLTKQYGRIWFQPVVGGEWDPEGVVAVWLDRHARLVNSYSYRDLRLQLYLSASSALRNSTAAATLFANDIRLVGFDLTYEADNAPGKTAQVVLFWQALRSGNRDATVFLHLYNPEGKLTSQQDSQPVHDSYPTHEWAAGETIVDAHQLQIPANLARGDYVIVLGMYDSATQERVPILESQVATLPQDRMVLANLDIK